MVYNVNPHSNKSWEQIEARSQLHAGLFQTGLDHTAHGYETHNIKSHKKTS